MPLLIWVTVGTVCALLLELLVSGRGRFAIDRLAVSILLAIDGALLAVFVSSPRGWNEAVDLSTRNLAVAALGAIVVVLGWKAVLRNNGSHTSTDPS